MANETLNWTIVTMNQRGNVVNKMIVNRNKRLPTISNIVITNKIKKRRRQITSNRLFNKKRDNKIKSLQN